MLDMPYICYIRSLGEVSDIKNKKPLKLRLWRFALIAFSVG